MRHRSPNINCNNIYYCVSQKGFPLSFLKRSIRDINLWQNRTKQNSIETNNFRTWNIAPQGLRIAPAPRLRALICHTIHGPSPSHSAHHTVIWSGSSIMNLKSRCSHEKIPFLRTCKQLGLKQITKRSNPRSHRGIQYR